MSKRLLAIAAAAAVLAIGAPPIGAQQTGAPYYIRTAGPVSSTSLTFGNLAGQETCAMVLNPTGGGNVVLVSGNLNINGSSATPVLTYYDAGGNSLGTGFTALGAKTFWFACPNATSVTFQLTTTLSYSYTFVATSAPWPFGGQGAAIPTPAPTSPADGAILVHNTTSDFTKSLNLAPTNCAIASAANTKNLCLSGSTTQNRYVWLVDSIGNTAAGAGLVVQVGQQSVTACDTNCVTWTAANGLGTTAALVTCIWGVPAPPGSFGTCGAQIIGIPLPASNPTTNLYLTSGGTAPVGATGWAYASTVGY